MRLWDFALAVYDRPGVEAACLTLQDDYGQCVPLLLWRLWALDRRIDAATLSSAVALGRDWDQRVVAPLRSVRRGLATPMPAISDAPRLSLRASVKVSELAAERLLLESLETLTSKDKTGGKAAVDALVELADAWSPSAPITLLTYLADSAASVTGCRIADSGYGHER